MNVDQTLVLDDLALKYGTDKGSTDHNYCPHYEQYFGRHRDEPLTLLELGVYKGASMQMWRDYFPNATIVGLDRNPTAVTNCFTYVGDQADSDTIEKMAKFHGPFDIIIDDASHISSKTIASFDRLYQHLAPGGVYVIEDLQTSYDEKNYGTSEALANPNLHLAEKTYTAMGLCKRLADEVNGSLFNQNFRLGYDLSSVQFFPNIVFITKAGTWTTQSA